MVSAIKHKAGLEGSKYQKNEFLAYFRRISFVKGIEKLGIEMVLFSEPQFILLATFINLFWVSEYHTR